MDMDRFEERGVSLVLTEAEILVLNLVLIEWDSTTSCMSNAQKDLANVLCYSFEITQRLMAVRRGDVCHLEIEPDVLIQRVMDWSSEIEGFRAEHESKRPFLA